MCFTSHKTTFSMLLNSLSVPVLFYRFGKADHSNGFKNEDGQNNEKLFDCLVLVPRISTDFMFIFGFVTKFPVFKHFS
jgi:hypothetical protein